MVIVWWNHTWGGLRVPGRSRWSMEPAQFRDVVSDHTAQLSFSFSNDFIFKEFKNHMKLQDQCRARISHPGFPCSAVRTAALDETRRARW